MRRFALIVLLIAVLALAMPVAAASRSPFIGHWQAIDFDGSDIRLTISGNGPYQITWTESYFSFCNREPGIAKGTGNNLGGDPNTLQANIHVKCLTLPQSTDLTITWTYNSDGTITGVSPSFPDPGWLTWHRPGR
jgi:hypothetical protein